MDVTGYRREDEAAYPGIFPPYRSTVKRGPLQPLIHVPHTLTEVTGPSDWEALMGPAKADLTRDHKGEPIGQRIVVTGQILDESGRPVPNTVMEIWQCNAAGRYIHKNDQWDAPLDPNFTGSGRVITDVDGRYSYVTIRPGAYPWGNHKNAWRPAHIHLSLLGPAFATRLVTQMYFPDDPLIEIDPIAGAIPERERRRMVARFDIDTTRPDWALGYLHNIVLRGREATPMENRP